jgi:hypothetical protein
MIMDAIAFSSLTHAVIPLVGLVITLHCLLKGFRQGGQPISTAAEPGTALQSCYGYHIGVVVVVVIVVVDVAIVWHHIHISQPGTTGLPLK